MLFFRGSELSFWELLALDSSGVVPELSHIDVAWVVGLGGVMGFF